MALKLANEIHIQTGESLSDGADCREGQIVRLTMSRLWTPANISFQISTDGDQYNDLVDTNGEEYVMPVVPGSAVVLGQYANFLRAIAFIKIRSGTSENPVEQEDLRSFSFALEVPDDEAPPPASSRR